MSMTTLGAVGLGAGAVAAAGAVVGGGYLVWLAGKALYDIANKRDAIKNLIQEYPLFPCLAAIMLVSSVVLCCASGYVSFLLANAVWMKAGIPSLFVPLGVAAVSGLIAIGSYIRGNKMAGEIKDSPPPSPRFGGTTLAEEIS